MRFFILTALVTLLLASCAQHIVPGIEVDSKLKGYILPKSNVLAGFDLEKAEQSNIFKRHRSEIQLQQLDQLQSQIGVDPRRFSSFLLAWNGNDLLALARGNYSAGKIEERLEKVTKSEKYNNLTLYGDGKHDVVFLPKGVALAGAPTLLKQALKENAAGTAGIPEEMRGQLERLNKAAQFWEISSGVIPLSQYPVHGEAASALANIVDYINATAVGITLSSGINLDAHITCVSEEGSQRVNDALRGVIGLARLSTKDDQLDQLKIWDSIKVEKQAREVHVTADLPADLADKAIALSKGLTYRLR